MYAATAPSDARPCRTCGCPRGVNIAEGTRCARCGQRHALILWIGAVFVAGEWTLFYGGRLSDGVTAAAVAFIAFLPAIVGAVLVHELCHALAGRLLNQTVSRVLVGEGRAIARVGRDPEFVFGSVIVGNGLTTVMDLRIDGYRRRMIAMLLLAPLVSLVIGVAMWIWSADWMLPARTAARVCALANLGLGLITLVPVPAFGARVWSDLAAARYLWHATDTEIVEHALLSVQDRLVILLEWHETDVALSTARRAVAMAPDAPLAYCLLAFTLLNAGHREEAVGVARDALAGQVDDNSRAYLTKLVEEAERHGCFDLKR